MWKTVIDHSTNYCETKPVFLLSGAPGGGPGIPQIVHQSALQVSFERSEEDEDHGV